MSTLQYDLVEPLTKEEKEWLQIMETSTLPEFVARLKNLDCKRCELGNLDNKVVVYRGSLNAQIMLVGEAPGLKEDQTGRPFVGPAGALLDKIMASISLDTEKDLYISNICKCRPIAPKSSGKQNFTPDATHHAICKVHLNREIELLDPKIIIACGLTSAKGLFGLGDKTLMKHVVGKFFTKDDNPVLKGRQLLVMYHPAAILHAGETRKQQLRQAIWEHMQILQTKMKKLGIQ